MPKLEVRFFGECRFVYDGQPVSGLQTKRMRSLLGYLLLHAGQQISATHLAFLFWPDSAEKQARTNLRRAFFNLRQVFLAVDEFLERSDHSVLWHADADASLDVDAFTADVTRARERMNRAQIPAAIAALEAATTRYQGDLLPDCYDDWIAAPREQLRQEYLFALEQLTVLHEQAGDYAAAIRYGEILLRKDTLRERSYHTLMQLYMLDGDRPAALRVYHACASELARELGVEPDAELTALYNQLLAGDGAAPVSADAQATPHIPAREELVGRKPERRTLTTAWRKAAAGQAGVVLIRGEAGLGKTRLAEELYRWAEQMGIAAAATRAYDGASALAYAPVVDWLRAPALDARVGQLDPARLAELTRLVPEIRITHPTLPPSQPLTESWQRTRLFDALAHTFCGGNQPLLLWLDDLQWCDGETLAWLQYLMQSARTAPLLVLGTVRDDELESDHPLRQWEQTLRRSDQLTEVTLAPLTDAESIALGQMVSHGRLGERDLAQYSRLAQGNPLFMLEMVRAGMEVAEAGDAPAASDDEPSGKAAALPPKVYSVIQARLAKLSSTAQAVVALAASVGRSFAVELLVHVGELDEGALVQALDELWRRRIIKESAAGRGGDMYDFSHDRIRDVAYGQLSSIRRRYYHRALAAALTDIHAAQLDASSAEIARHHELAGNRTAAVDCYKTAAAWATAQFVHADTIRYLSRALDLLDAQDRDGRYTLLALRAQAYQMQAARSEQTRDLDAMMALAETMQDRVRRTDVLLRRAALAEIQGNYAGAIATIAQIPWHDTPGHGTPTNGALDSTAPTNGAPDHTAPDQNAGIGAVRRRQEVEAAVRLGSAYWNQGNYPRAEVEYRRGLKLAQQVGDRAQETTILLHLGALNAYYGPYDEALSISRAALAAALAVGNEEGQIWARNQLGFLIVEQGEDDYREAEDALVTGLDLARKTGNRTYIAKLANNLAMLYDHMGKHDDGLMYLDEALTIAQGTGSARHQAFALNYRGNLLLNRGDYAQAEDAYAHALELFRTIGYRQGEGKTLSELAVLALILDDPTRALDHADAARAIAVELGLQRDVAAACTRTGYILERQGSRQAAEAMYGEALQLYAGTGQRRRGLQPTAGCARLAWAAGDRSRARAMADEIAAQIRRFPLDATTEAQWVVITCAHLLEALSPQKPDDNDRQTARQTHLHAFRNAFETPLALP